MFDEHGKSAAPFGKWKNQNSDNLDRFINDRNTLYYGVKNDDGYIHWSAFVFKITDVNGNLLTYDNGKDAVFIDLKSAFEAFANETFKDEDNTASSNPTPYYIKALIDSFTIGSDDVVGAGAIKESRPVHLTTESKTYTGKYPYDGDEDRCTLIRANDNKNLLFDVGAERNLTITNLVIDGNQINVGGNAKPSAGLINVSGNLTLSDGAELCNAKGWTETARGGAIYIANGGILTMEGSEDNYASIHDCIGRSSGAVYVANGASFTMQGYAQIYDCESKKANGNQYGGNGGAVTVGQGGNAGTFIQQGNSLISNCKAQYYGGAVYVEIGTYTLTGSAAIKGCTADAGVGAGIFLEEKAVLKLSGSPSFGDGSTDDNPANTVAISDYSTKQNGGLNVYTDDKARQDIYIAGFGGKDATSVQVVGSLTSGDGTIWVWAKEAPHYKEDEQFAIFGGDAVNSSKEVVLTTAEQSASMRAFRNARADSDTTESGERDVGDYLLGVSGDVETYIYWGTDGMDVIFTKVDGFGEPLAGASFTLYKALTDTTGVKTGVSADGVNTVDSKNIKLDKGIVKLEKIPNGIYYMKEVLEDGTNGAPTGYVENTNTYIVLVGTSNLTPGTTAIWTDGALSTLDEAKINAQRGTLNTETNKYERDYAIFQIDVDSTSATLNQAVTTPDIAANGIMNVSASQRKVILRKVDGGTDANRYKSLPGAKFTVYYADRQTVVKVDGTQLKDLTSGNSGAFFIGKLPYGIYYMEETQTPVGYKDDKYYFVIRVDENGVSTNPAVSTTGGETVTTWTKRNIVSKDTGYPIASTTPTTPTP